MALLEGDNLHQGQQSGHTGECIPGPKRTDALLAPGFGEGVVGSQMEKGLWNQVLKDFAQPKSLDLNSN